MIIYIITNSVNGKLYVGMTSRTETSRWRDHLREAANGSPLPLHAAIRKYGKEAFTVKIHQQIVCSRDELGKLEAAAISTFDSRAPKGYNLTTGGDGNKGISFSKASRLRLSLASKARWANLTPEQRTELNFKISEAKKGRSLPHAVGNTYNKNRVRSKDFKSRISVSMAKVVAKLPPGEMSRRAKMRKNIK